MTRLRSERPAPRPSRGAGPARGVPAFALFCDDSGGERDTLRAAACVSGPAGAVAELERSLRGVLERTGVRELKWSALRTRRERLAAAREFLDLAVAAAAHGRLRVEVLLWRPGRQSAAARSRGEVHRLAPVYGRLWRASLRAWPRGDWSLWPDERTGMPWGGIADGVLGSLGRPAPYGLVVQGASSRDRACVQLADLFAGLCRVEGEAPGTGAAWANRRALRTHLLQACLRRGIPMRRAAGLLASGGRRMKVRLLRRLPARP